ncbi:hypothetical protein [Arsenicicoccus dermatophilus]|uniref:hypothetical protein n=1 Tax=Arsenicicoccus dermatophilus TaxID=1076331 RepID=UPI001F4CE7C8|nr:hypothetical protein [Arsenicicoccus dermatophilus]MCH8612171.1 hypothetical protein [Arsenicicoccus dermatophilus]
MHRRPLSARTPAARSLAAPALLCAIALSACSGGGQTTFTSSSTGAPAATSAASAAATSHEAVTVGVLDKAVAEARQAPALSKAADDQVRGWLKAACAAHLAGMPDAQVPAAVAQDMQVLGGNAQAGAQAVVPVARKLLCP